MMEFFNKELVTVGGVKVTPGLLAVVVVAIFLLRQATK